jgi:hypothetical protein
VVNLQHSYRNAWQLCTGGLVIGTEPSYIVHCSKERGACDLLKWAARFP